eukprot:747481_1
MSITSYFSPVNANGNHNHNSNSSYFPNLSYEYGVCDVALHYNESEVPYKYEFNKNLIPDSNNNANGFHKGFVKKKPAAIATIRKIYGHKSVVVGTYTKFNRTKEESKTTKGYGKQYMRCPVCTAYPSHIKKVANLRTTDGTIASMDGSKYKIESLINHYTSDHHQAAVEQSRADDLMRFHESHPSVDAAETTNNVLLQQILVFI